MPPSSGAVLSSGGREYFARGETEFFEVERFRSREDFLSRAATYMVYFNTVRKNSGKEMKTPWEVTELRPVERHD